MARIDNVDQRMAKIEERLDNLEVHVTELNRSLQTDITAILQLLQTNASKQANASLFSHCQPISKAIVQPMKKYDKKIDKR